MKHAGSKMDNVKSTIPLLNSGNFVFWKTELKAVLVRDEL